MFFNANYLYYVVLHCVIIVVLIFFENLHSFTYIISHLYFYIYLYNLYTCTYIPTFTSLYYITFAFN